MNEFEYGDGGGERKYVVDRVKMWRALKVKQINKNASTKRNTNQLIILTLIQTLNGGITEQ